LLDREALQSTRNEDLQAPRRTDVEFEPDAIGMQVQVLAFVEVDRQYVEPYPVAAIERSLGAQRGAEPGTVLAD
jgi:hypothetical protein